jgi:hypothetical protein
VFCRENLRLDATLPARGASAVVAPLAVEGAPEAPARVMAFVTGAREADTAAAAPAVESNSGHGSEPRETASLQATAPTQPPAAAAAAGQTQHDAGGPPRPAAESGCAAMLVAVTPSPSRPASVCLRRSDSSPAGELSAAGNFQRPRASSQASKAISGRCRHWPVDWAVTSTCSACGLPGAASCCSRCSAVRYCDRRCQKRHWTQHKLTCGRLSVWVGEAGPSLASRGFAVIDGFLGCAAASALRREVVALYQASSCSSSATWAAEVEVGAAPSSSDAPAAAWRQEQPPEFAQGAVAGGREGTDRSYADRTVRGDRMTNVNSDDPRIPTLATLVTRLDELVQVTERYEIIEAVPFESTGCCHNVKVPALLLVQVMARSAGGAKDASPCTTRLSTDPPKWSE